MRAIWNVSTCVHGSCDRPRAYFAMLEPVREERAGGCGILEGWDVPRLGQNFESAAAQLPKVLE